MANLFHGKTLHWAAYDPSRVIATAVHSMLNDLLDEASGQHLTLVETPQDIVANSDLGLALWRLVNLDDLSPACTALDAVASRNASTLRMVYLNVHHANHAATLVEAGAQIVVSQLPSLQRAICTCVPKAHLAQQGFHPLTSHLLGRLPWPELDDEVTDHSN